jgi:hypothetical protein
LLEGKHEIKRLLKLVYWLRFCVRYDVERPRESEFKVIRVIYYVTV